MAGKIKYNGICGRAQFVSDMVARRGEVHNLSKTDAARRADSSENVLRQLFVSMGNLQLKLRLLLIEHYIEQGRDLSAVTSVASQHGCNFEGSEHFMSLLAGDAAVSNKAVDTRVEQILKNLEHIKDEAAAFQEYRKGLNNGR